MNKQLITAGILAAAVWQHPARADPIGPLYHLSVCDLASQCGVTNQGGPPLPDAVVALSTDSFQSYYTHNYTDFNYSIDGGNAAGTLYGKVSYTDSISGFSHQDTFISQFGNVLYAADCLETVLVGMNAGGLFIGKHVDEPFVGHFDPNNPLDFVSWPQLDVASVDFIHNIYGTGSPSDFFSLVNFNAIDNNGNVSGTYEREIVRLSAIDPYTQTWDPGNQATDVPEPSSLAIMLGALILFLIRKRRWSGNR